MPHGIVGEHPDTGGRGSSSARVLSSGATWQGLAGTGPLWRPLHPFWRILLVPVFPGQPDSRGECALSTGRVKARWPPDLLGCLLPRSQPPFPSVPVRPLPGCSWAVLVCRSPGAPDFKVGTLPVWTQEGLADGTQVESGAEVRR